MIIWVIAGLLGLATGLRIGWALVNKQSLVSTAMILLAAAVLVLIGLLQRVWLPLACYGLFAFILAVGSAGYYHSRPRMLVPVLVLLIPVAVALARTKPRIAIPIAIALTAAGCWYGAYMITVWPFTI